MQTITEIPHQISKGLIQPDLCSTLIKLASLYVTPAMVGKPGKRQLITNSRSAFNAKADRLSVDAQELVAQPIQNQVAIEVQKFSGLSADQLAPEPLEVVMYPPGGHFARHHDGYERSYSAIVTLNSGYSGGELLFAKGPQLDLGLFPVGTVLCWENIPTAHHECHEIRRGVKWIAVTWFRKFGERDD